MTTADWTGRARGLWTEAVEVWAAGGWAMWAIAAVALALFGMGCHVWLVLREKRTRRVPEAIWRRWIESPKLREGRLGELLDTATSARDLDEMAAAFHDLRVTETVPIERDLKVMKICVSAAPLVGLLGTVTGMLSTFGALASGSGGDKTMAMVASGISEALITTETGLIVALPGLFFQYQLARQHERYKAFLAHLQTVCAQVLYRTQRSEGRAAVRRAALAEVARLIRERLRPAASREEAYPRFTTSEPSEHSVRPAVLRAATELN